MANCPRCGSESIQLQRDTEIDWGRAIVGTVLFGVVGGAVGAVTGEDRNANVCLNCGATWKAAVLYEMLKFIERETGRKLNLTNENERDFLNEVMIAADLCSYEVEQIERRAEFSIQEKKGGGSVASVGCFVVIVILISIGLATGSGEGILVLAFILVFYGVIAFAPLSSTMKGSQSMKKELEGIAKSHEEAKVRAKQNFKIKLRQIREKYLI